MKFIKEISYFLKYLSKFYMLQDREYFLKLN